MRKKGAELVFLGELPDGEEVIDFYHAAGHLDTALAAAYGDTHPKRRAQFEKQRHVLLEDYKGVEKPMIRSLVHLRDTYPRRKKIARELKYFRRNRHRMRYAALKEQGLPIGSGVTEAACKTLSNATHEEVRNAMGRARRPSVSPFYPSALSCRAIASSEPGPCSHIPTRRRLRLSTMSCRYAVGNDRCQYESYTQIILIRSPRVAEHDVLRAFPEHELSKRLQLIEAFDDREKMIAGEPPHLAREQRAPVSEQNLRFAEAAGVKQDIPARGMARVVLEWQLRIELSDA